MKVIFSITFVILLFIYGKSEAQEVTVVDFDEFEPLLHQKGDTLYMVHFWATWCKPCIKEMPLILEMANKYRDKKLKMILVSLDFTKSIETRLIPYLQQNSITQKVYLLDDTDYNSWIDKVDASWSGSIPSTLFFSRTVRDFYEGSFEKDELDSIIKFNLKTL